MRPTALIVAPHASTRRTIARAIRRRGRRVLRADGPERARHLATEHEIDVTLLDLSGLDEVGILLIPVLLDLRPRLRIILLKRPEQVPLSIRGMKLGAFDDVTMPLDLDRFATLVDAALDRTGEGADPDLARDSVPNTRQE